jgi:serine O-acetyltransferase
MFRLILSDVRAKAAWCYQDQSATALLKVLMTDGTTAMLLYRAMQWARAHRLPPLEWIFNKLNVMTQSCIIGRGAEFGPGFVLIHATGVVINGDVKGGSGIYIEHQVTIGADRRSSPRLGDGVFIGAGAKIIGPVRVGSHSRIGANAVVVSDIPDHATAVGVPARVVRVCCQDAFSTTRFTFNDDDVVNGRTADVSLEPGDSVMVR